MYCVRHLCCRCSRSSLHYDPYHNLLCLVQGSKTVKLISPEYSDQLYPLSILGESPNHSHVNFARPDLGQHPLYAQAYAHHQEFTLQVLAASDNHAVSSIRLHATPILASVLCSFVTDLQQR